MKAFKCSKCGNISYSAAALEHQINPSCPYCKADKSHISEETSGIENTDSICVMCGAYVPEGRLACPICEADPYHVLKEK